MKKLTPEELLGYFIGTLDGICYWDIPEELKVKLKAKSDELRNTELDYSYIRKLDKASGTDDI